MCGRFKLSKPVQAVGDLFALPAPPDILRPRYNVAPSQNVWLISTRWSGPSLCTAEAHHGSALKESKRRRSRALVPITSSPAGMPRN